MKKTYIKPEEKIVTVNTRCNLLGFSGGGVNVVISNDPASGDAEGRDDDNDW